MPLLQWMPCPFLPSPSLPYPFSTIHAPASHPHRTSPVHPLSNPQEVSNPALESRHWSNIFGILGQSFEEGQVFCVQDLIG